MATAKKPKLTATAETKKAAPRRKPATTAAAKEPTTTAAPQTRKAASKTKSLPEVRPEEIERLAYQLWEERGRPEGNSLEDWTRAQEILLSRANRGSEYQPRIRVGGVPAEPESPVRGQPR
jgi:hypothetical protein